MGFRFNNLVITEIMWYKFDYASLNRPEGNVTGLADMANELLPKLLGLLQELVPRATRFGVLVNPSALPY